MPDMPDAAVDQAEQQEVQLLLPNKKDSPGPAAAVTLAISPQHSEHVADDSRCSRHFLVRSSSRGCRLLPTPLLVSLLGNAALLLLVAVVWLRTQRQPSFTPFSALYNPALHSHDSLAPPLYLASSELFDALSAAALDIDRVKLETEARSAQQLKADEEAAAAEAAAAIPWSTVRCRPSTARGLEASLDHRVCVYENVWFSTGDNEFFFTSAAPSPDGTPPVIPATAYMRSSAPPPHPFRPLAYPAGQLPVSSGSGSGSGRPTLVERRVTHITGTSSKHQYHGLFDDWFGQYVEMTEHAGTPLFIDRARHTMMYYNVTRPWGGNVDIDQETGVPLEWHASLMPLFTNEPLPTAARLRKQGHEWVLFKEVVAMGTRWPRSVNVQEAYWYLLRLPHVQDPPLHVAVHGAAVPAVRSPHGSHARPALPLRPPPAGSGQ